MRSRSPGGNDGRSATSAMIGSEASRRATGTCSITVVWSMPAAASRSAPRKSTASAISSDDLLPAPSSSIAAVRLATPNLPGGSSDVPLKTTRFTYTTGTLCSSTIQTGTPFESCRFWIAGRFSVAGGPGCGGRVRSGACCADRTAVAAATTVRSTKRRIIMDDSVASAARSRRTLLFFRLHHDLDTAAGRQKRARGGADVRRRQRAVAGEILVEPVRVAGVRVVRVQLIGFAPETADALHPVVEGRFNLIDGALQLVV